MKIPELMIESTEEKYTYKYILTLIKSIYSLVQASNFRIKEYINTMTLKAGIKQWNTDTCILYGLYDIGTEIVIVYVNKTLEIWDKPEFMDTIELIKK